MPKLYSHCSSAYNQPSILLFGLYTVQSQKGLQQGDLIGPLRFFAFLCLCCTLIFCMEILVNYIKKTLWIKLNVSFALESCMGMDKAGNPRWPR